MTICVEFKNFSNADLSFCCAFLTEAGTAAMEKPTAAVRFSRINRYSFLLILTKTHTVRPTAAA